jgi:predicted nucleic acid-binding protein
MNRFLLDASALIKRYAPEPGSAAVNHLFVRATPARLACLTLGAAEVLAGLVRKRNGGSLSPGLFAAAVAQLKAEIFHAPGFLKLSADDALVERTLPLLERYAINSTDAVLLQAALEGVVPLRASGDDLVLVASDRRLLTAAQAERLLTFNPETQSQAEVDALIGP